MFLEIIILSLSEAYVSDFPAGYGYCNLGHIYVQVWSELRMSLMNTVVGIITYI